MFSLFLSEYVFFLRSFSMYLMECKLYNIILEYDESLEKDGINLKRATAKTEYFIINSLISADHFQI